LIKKNSYEITPIGNISRDSESTNLNLSENYKPALKQLEGFSHILVIWWANKHDNPKSRNIMQCKLPYAEGQVAGVFACRAEYRPNPIAVTVCEIIDVNKGTGVVKIRNIDAYDDTPLLDLKPYIPVCDRVQHVKVPAWFSDWPAWFPDDGLGLYEE
jgi:tRNA-Thr(GGU) m(6)t(6)A37 methyltransferase TsaA